MTENTEQALKEPSAAAAEKVSNGADVSTSVPKFKSERELAEAYTRLEKEFTRRSQKLKALEKELAQAKAARADIEQTIPETRGMDSISEREREEIINSYILELKKSTTPNTISGGGGAFSVAPSIRPKSLYDAGKMTEELFKNL